MKTNTKFYQIAPASQSSYSLFFIWEVMNSYRIFNVVFFQINAQKITSE